MAATATAPFTCITCRLAFSDADVQRAHYKTDWHRYNLRRKVAAMAPVTAEGFEERVWAQRALAEQRGRATATYCAACCKRFASFNAYDNHLRSRRHAELERKAVAAVSQRVARLNAKNREKGLSDGEGEGAVDKDAVNAAIQRAIKAQPSPKKAPAASDAEEDAPRDRDKDKDKPPRLQWFEQQARKLAKQQGEEDDEEDLEEEEDGKGPDGHGARLGGPCCSSWGHFLGSFSDKSLPELLACLLQVCKIGG